ncbi:DUF3574 domain-containing protein [Larkinella soli]|uniref:DUF3574 domain-containing protein n=1 Tax=Larkinella soli TaxID=1770527 RepID=UPI0035B59C98
MKCLSLVSILRLLIVVLLADSCHPRGLLPTNQVHAHASVWELDRLYFGRSRSDGSQVSEREWRSFLTEVVTPRFPDGLTLWRAEGQWRDSTGAIVHECSYLLELVHPNGAHVQQKLKEIVTEYKRRFRQESVLRISGPVWVEF